MANILQLQVFQKGRFDSPQTNCFNEMARKENNCIFYVSQKSLRSCELDSTTAQTSRAGFNDIFPPSKSHPPHDFPYSFTSPPEEFPH